MAWQQNVNLWQPDEIERAGTGMYGMTGKDTADQMKSAWQKMMQSSSGPNPYEQQENARYADEQNMLHREQQRREFDSQTAREGQQQKNSLLRGLLGNSNMNGGYSFSRTFGDRQ